MPDALVLDGVSKIYEVGGIELVALHDVDLSVAEEEVVTLLGPSGSGKTTLLSIAGGLLSATTGKVIVGGKNITRARARKLTTFRRKRIGFIFQAVNLVPFLTARENLLVVAELARRDRAAAVRRADRLLEELGLGHRMSNLPSQLSGGERQRVAIGRALMNQPALVLVDEPTSALDSDLGTQVMELIVSEVKARGAAAVVVTHDQRMARYGDRILTMADGRIAGMAPRPEFTLGRGPAPAAALEAASDVRALPAASGGVGGFGGFDGFGGPPVSGRVPVVGGSPPMSGRVPTVGGAAGPRRPAAPAASPPSSPLSPPPTPGPAPFPEDAPAAPTPGPAPFPEDAPAARSDTGTVPAGLWANGPAVTPGIDRSPPPEVQTDAATGPPTSTPQDFASFWGEDAPDDLDRSSSSRSNRRSRSRDRRSRDGDRPATGQVPATAWDGGSGRQAGNGFTPGTGQVPATAWDGSGHGGTGTGQVPAWDDGAGAGLGSGTGQIPATAWDGGAGNGEVPATAWDGGASGPGAGNGFVPGAEGGPAAEWGGMAHGGAGTGQVPATTWDDGLGAEGLQWGTGPGTGQQPATGRYGPQTGQGPAVRPDQQHGHGVPEGWPDPAAPRGRATQGPPTSGQVPIAQPLSGQTPVVPTPDRVWRRPATPPSGRSTGGRRPPPLRPAPAALPVEGWPEPSPRPAPVQEGWPEPSPRREPVPEGWPEPQAAPAAPTPARTWGTPEFFAEPPPGQAGYPPSASAPFPDDDEIVDAEVVDEVETDRVRWLQQLTPPPTKAQPRPLALPDRPIWPTRYWTGEAGDPGDPGVDEADAEADYDYDFGEYDDES